MTFSLFGVHPIKGTPVVRFAEAVTTEKNPVATKISGVSTGEAEDLVAYLTEHIYSDAYCRVHEWQAGDLVLADNHSLLHGRRGFAKTTPRHIRRVQIR